MINRLFFEYGGISLENIEKSPSCKQIQGIIETKHYVLKYFSID